MKMNIQRGVLTPEVKEAMENFLKEESTVTQLRLLPYLLHCLMNNGNLNLEKINDEEGDILAEWNEKGFISITETNYILRIGDRHCLHTNVKIRNKEFYDWMCNIIYLSYINK